MEYRLRPWVSWSCLQNNNHQAVKKMEWIENRKIRNNTDKKPLGFRSCVVVNVWVYVGVCVCVYVLELRMDACFYKVKPGYKRSALRKRIWIRVYLNNSLHYFISVCVGDYSNGAKHHHCMSRRMNIYIYIYIYAIIFSAEINLWRLNRVWVSIKLYYIYIYI